MIKKSKLSLVDDVGLLAFNDNFAIRYIHKEYSQFFIELFQSGLIDELLKFKLVVETQIDKENNNNDHLILLHKKIEPIIYPFEWSPEMHRAAGMALLEINKIANFYGYEIKDAHPYNVVFDGSTPKFVDFGSFIKQKNKLRWVASEQFESSFIIPLLLCQNGLINLYKNYFLRDELNFDSSEIRYLLSFSRKIINFRIYKKFDRYLRLYKSSLGISKDSIRKRIPNAMLCYAIYCILSIPFLPLRKINYDKLKNKLSTIKIKSYSTWGEYHETAGLIKECHSQTEIKLSSRMEWIYKQVERIAPSTIVELAGNQGALSRELAKIESVTNIICSDYDSNAIDKLFLARRNYSKITPAYFNFIGESWERIADERGSRLRSDLVIALAVIHHLVLTQNYDFGTVFESLSEYTNDYLIVEFMPLGLWDGNKAPDFPSWYNEINFVNNMTKYFNIIERSMLEKNRVAFVARKKKE